MLRLKRFWSASTTIARGKGAALALPYADTNAMQLRLDEISRHVAPGAQAVLLMDRAGWHTTANLGMPDNITPIFLPSRAPELNPVENIWQYLRANLLSLRRHHRCRLRGLAQARSSATGHHLDRNPPMDQRWSIPIAAGIIGEFRADLARRRVSEGIGNYRHRGQ
jgi:transposase